MISKILIHTSFVISLVLLQGCMQTLDVTPAEVTSEINAQLKSGDSAFKIEDYFKSKGLSASFDAYSNRYQSIIRHPDSNFHAITIYIYVDNDKNFKSVEANDSYTFL